MNQHHGGARRACWRGFHDMQTAALERDPLTDRGVARLEPARKRAGENERRRNNTEERRDQRLYQGVRLHIIVCARVRASLSGS